MVTVLLFGRIADAAGWRERRLDPAPTSVDALRRRLVADQPELEGALTAMGVQVAVDLAIVRGDAAVRSGSEVAFLPPMSGG